MKTQKTHMKMIVTFLIVLFLIAAPGAAEPTITREIPASPGGRLELDLKTGGTIEVTGRRKEWISTPWAATSRCARRRCS